MINNEKVEKAITDLLELIRNADAEKLVKLNMSKNQLEIIVNELLDLKGKTDGDLKLVFPHMVIDSWVYGEEPKLQELLLQIASNYRKEFKKR